MSEPTLREQIDRIHSTRVIGPDGMNLIAAGDYAILHGAARLLEAHIESSEKIDASPGAATQAQMLPTPARRSGAHADLPLSDGADAEFDAKDYYRGSNGIELGDIIEGFGLGFYEGACVKYVIRSRSKGAPIEDLRKAIASLNREIKIREREMAAAAVSESSSPPRDWHGVLGGGAR